MIENIDILPGVRVDCPHCSDVVRFVKRQGDDIPLVNHGGGAIKLRVLYCPNCRMPILQLVHTHEIHPGRESITRAYPTAGARPIPPPAVPSLVTEIYVEARSVEMTSPRAAAALLRACLQAALRDCGFRGRRLIDEIGLAEADPRSTPMLAEKLHIVREVGNYAVHPTETDTGDILIVEPGEVDALFDALREFFDLFYVKPQTHAKQLEQINNKLTAAGKKPIGT